MVCTHMYINTHMHTHTHTHTRAHTHTHTHARAHTHTHTHTHTRTRTRAHTHTHTHTPVLLDKHATIESNVLENAGMQNVVWESQYLIQAGKYDARASEVQGNERFEHSCQT